MTTTKEKEMTCPKGYVEVIATAPGFYGVGKMGSRISVEETFYVKEGTRLSGWFRPLHPEDAVKLLPSRKAEKLAMKHASISASRIAKDPAAMFRTVREIAAANAPLPLPPGKVFEPPKHK